MRRLIVFCSSAVLYMTMSCAKIEPPPGGPIDKTGPSILSTSPSSEAVAVPLSDELTINFSENINPASVEGSIFISPHFLGKSKYKWHGKNLSVRLPRKFDHNTTYIVNIGTSLSDQRNNRMEHSYRFAFSTGERIDKGKISGKVLMDNKAVPGASVALYDTTQIHLLNMVDSLIPSFLTQTGAEGEYLLDYLSHGTYFVFAFQDKNRNLAFDYPDESFGVPDRLAGVDSTLAEPVMNFNLKSEDTTTLGLQSITITADRLIRVRLTRPVRLNSELKNQLRASLFSYGSGDTLTGIVQPLLTDTISAFNIHFESLTEGKYKLLLNLKADWPPEDLLLQSGDIELRIEADETPPELLLFSHKDKTIYPSDTAVEFIFSEPVDRNALTDSTFQLVRKSDSSRVAPTLNLDNPFGIVMATGALQKDEVYQARVNLAEIMDLSGNRAADTAVTFKFRTYDSDSLGAVSGNIIAKDSAIASKALCLEFNSLNEGRDWRYSAGPGNFNFQLPPGKYILSGFVDEDNNNRHDIGNLVPLEFSEISAIYPDTIRVRARFETAGIEFYFR